MVRDVGTPMVSKVFAQLLLLSSNICQVLVCDGDGVGNDLACFPWNFIGVRGRLEGLLVVHQ